MPSMQLLYDFDFLRFDQSYRQYFFLDDIALVKNIFVVLSILPLTAGISQLFRSVFFRYFCHYFGLIPTTNWYRKCNWCQFLLFMCSRKKLSIYFSAAPPAPIYAQPHNKGVDLRYAATYGNPYLRNSSVGKIKNILEVKRPDDEWPTEAWRSNRQNASLNRPRSFQFSNRYAQTRLTMQSTS